MPNIYQRVIGYDMFWLSNGNCQYFSFVKSSIAMALAYNLSYSGDREQEDRAYKPACLASMSS
jgi:hypothetical protein